MPGLLRSPLRDLERPTGVITVEESSPLADGLIAWWPLDPIYQGRNIIGSPPAEGVITAPGWQSEQGFGHALAGSGSTWVDSGANEIDDIAFGFEADKPFSISIWSKIPTSVSAMFAKASSSVTTNKTFHFFHQSGQAARTPRLDIRGSSNDTSWGWMDDLWHRYVMTWDGVEGILYGDGGDNVRSLTIGTAAIVDTNFTIGCRTANNPGTIFTGRLLDCQAWSRALSPAEVAIDYAPETRWGLYWRPSPRLVFPVSASPAAGHSATLPLTAAAATFSGLGSVNIPATREGVANLTAAPAEIDFAGTTEAPVFTGSLVLTAAPAAFDAAGTHEAPTQTASLSLTAAAAQFAATGQFATVVFSASMALEAAPAEFDSTGTFDSGTFTASMALEAAAASFAGAGTHVAPIMAGTLSLEAAPSVFSGDAAFASVVISATMDLVAAEAVFGATATFTAESDDGSVAYHYWWWIGQGGGVLGSEATGVVIRISGAQVLSPTVSGAVLSPTIQGEAR